MEDLWQQLKEILNAVTASKTRRNLTRSAVQESIALILLDVAFIDNTFDNSEYAAIVQGLQELLEIGYDEVVDLIQETRQLRVSQEVDLDLIGTFLGTQLSSEIRREILQLITDILISDHHLHPFEKALKERYRRLLFPSDTQATED